MISYSYPAEVASCPKKECGGILCVAAPELNEDTPYRCPECGNFFKPSQIMNVTVEKKDGTIFLKGNGEKKAVSQIDGYNRIGFIL